MIERSSGAGEPDPAPWAARPEDDEVPPSPWATIPAGFRRASSIARAVALVLDTLIVAFVAFLTSGVTGAVLGLDPVRDASLLVVLLYGFGTALSGFYFAGFWSGPRQATPAMRAFGLRIGRSEDGTPLSVPAALIRWVVTGAPIGAFLVIPGIGGLVSLVAVVVAIVLLASTLVSPTRQGLHDRAARSLVVQPDRAPPRELVACLVVAIGIALVSAGTFLVLLLVNRPAA